MTLLLFAIGLLWFLSLGSFVACALGIAARADDEMPAPPTPPTLPPANVVPMRRTDTQAVRLYAIQAQRKGGTMTMWQGDERSDWND